MMEERTIDLTPHCYTSSDLWLVMDLQKKVSQYEHGMELVLMLCSGIADTYIMQDNALVEKVAKAVLDLKIERTNLKSRIMELERKLAQEKEEKP